MLDTSEMCDQSEWNQRKIAKKKLVEQLLNSDDGDVLTIALRLQLSGHAGNARHLIQQWIDRS